MAQIPLDQVPNAPQGAFVPIGKSDFPTDQVGGQAKADIARGYQGAMVDPQQAGAVGRATQQFGSAIGNTGVNLATGAIYIASENQRKELAQAGKTGLIKFIQNENNLQNQYQTAIQGQPVEQYPVIWNKVVGENGNNYFNGMSPMEQNAMIPHVMNSWHQGMAKAANEVYQVHRQNEVSGATEAIQTKIQQGDFDGAKEGMNSAVANGYISKGDQIRLDNQIATQQQYRDLQAKVIADPTGPLAKEIQLAVDAGVSLKGYEKLSPENLSKLTKVADAVHNDQVWAVTDGFRQKIYAGQITDPKQLDEDPAVKALPQEQKDALHQSLTNQRAGTPEGDLAAKEGQALVNNFPTKESSNTKELLDAKTWILANVPQPFADDQIKALEKKQQERVENGGYLKPQSQLLQYGSQKLTVMLHAGIFGKYDPKVLNNTKGATFDQSKVDASTKAQAVKEDIYQKVLQSGAKTRQEVDKVINDETRTMRAGAGSQSSPGVLQKLWNSLFSGQNPMKTGSTGSPLGKVTSYGYKGDPNGDSLTKQGIAASGKIQPDTLSVSPDIESQMKDAGIKIGDKVALQLEGSDEPVIRTWNDRTMQDKEAIKQFGKPLRGRFDFYSPKGLADQEGSKVVGFRKA